MLQKHVANLPFAALADVGAVFDEVFALPDQAIALAGLNAVAPQVWSPHDQRRLYRSFGRVRIEVGIPFDLVLDQPSDDKALLIGIRFRVRSEERRVGKECRSRWS